MAATLRRSRASIRSSMSSARQPMRRPSARAMVLLPAPMNPTRYSLSVCTAGRGSAAQGLEYGEELGIGDRGRLGAVDRRGAAGAKRRDGKGHRKAMVVMRVDLAAAQTG